MLDTLPSLQRAIWRKENYARMVSLSPLSVPNSFHTKGHCSHSHNSLMTEINKGRWRKDDKTEAQGSEGWPERKAKGDREKERLRN